MLSFRVIHFRNVLATLAALYVNVQAGVSECERTNNKKTLDKALLYLRRPEMVMRSRRNQRNPLDAPHRGSPAGAWNVGAAVLSSFALDTKR